jgi:GxxExxY protein
MENVRYRRVGQYFGNHLPPTSYKRRFNADEGGMHADGMRLNELSGRVIGCAFTVLNTLGAGFLEKVYENALAHELRKAGLGVVQQSGITVTYDAIVVGQYFVDLVVEQALLVELKTVNAFDEGHRAGSVNYLKASGLQLCLLLNFGKSRLDSKRVANGL